jgi:putative peptidoglycan lipid II flippase
MTPALFGASVAQLNLLLDTLLASFLAAGSISWLYYSDRLVEFPLGVLGVALGTVILPGLTRRHAAQDPAAFSATLDWALRWVLLLGLPAAVGLAMLAGPLMATLFHSGAFSGEDVAMAGRSLMAYAVGLVGFMGIKVLAPGFYAREDTRTPVRIALIALTVNLALNLLLMGPLGHAGLALATTVAALVNAWLLLRGLRREGVYRPAPGWPGLLVRGFAATCAMGLLLRWGAGATVDWLTLGTGDRVMRLLGLVLGGMLCYFAALLVLGIRPRHFLLLGNNGASHL